MVASIDGATAVDGASGGLGGAADHAVFPAIRGVPDMIVAAAGTVRAEGYGAPKPSDRIRAMRRDRGQALVPRLAVVTRSIGLDLSSSLFAEAELPPLVITTETADPARLDAVRAAGGEIVAAGTVEVDLAAVFGMLRRSGTGIVLVEGGPSLNGQLVAADLIDEVCITVAPKLVGGDAARLAHGGPAVVSSFELAHVLELEGELCCRYVRALPVDE